MKELKHLVDIHVDRCIGCTRCMRVCPTEAIRIVNHKVMLLDDRCIYCGNCISNCHKSAYKITSDSFSNLSKHKVNVALLPLSVYGMVASHEDLNAVYQTLYNFGFDEVFDLSIVTHLLSEKINYMLNDSDKTYILTQCPSIVRLVQLKFPNLINHLLPFDFPFEIGAKMARKKYAELYKLNPEDIGISYISECLSNFIAIKEPLGKASSQVDYVFLFGDIFKSMVGINIDSKHINHDVSKKGIQYGKEGAIFLTTDLKEYVSVDGIHHVSNILEKVDLNAFSKVKLIEAYSCVCGCVGGNFTLENDYISKWKINHFAESLEDSEVYIDEYRNLIDVNEWYFKEIIHPSDPYKLSENVVQSMIKMNKINEILKKLPNIDCCACGSPSCRALSEDIVRGKKTIYDCAVLYKSDRRNLNESE